MPRRPRTALCGAVGLVGLLSGASDAGSAHLPERISPSGKADRCTTIVVGPKATVEEASITTYNADCAECDFRIARVPARDWPDGSMRPVYLFSSAFQNGRSKTWEVSNLEDLPQRKYWDTSFSRVLGHIPQVNHTYALVEGLYGIMNEHQVSIGESTCSGRFWTKPISHGGQALLEVGELSSIALERCDSARCAIKTMGDLAVLYGYYGAEWEGDIENIIGEAGEALTVADAKEAWIFHILPDDSGKSAIWAAQRVPDDHITVVANQFTIRKIIKGHPDFLYSDNLWSIAERNHLWSADQGDLDFLVTYGYLRVHSTYATRRMWRVFSLAAPSLNLPSETDDFASDYPWSVKPDRLLTTADLFSYQRDHFEGTKYSLTEGIAAGPYGDPNRYDPAANPTQNVSLVDANRGAFERSISLFRTSYSTVTTSRAHLPNLIGARFWFCQYMPSMSTFTPIYVSTPELPPSYVTGSLFKYTRTSSYWAAASVGNWATRFYRFIRQDVESEQRALEKPLFEHTDTREKEAMSLLAMGNLHGACDTLAEVSRTAASKALHAWNSLFDLLIAKYRDGYKVLDLNSPVFAQEFLFYPLWWLKMVGYFQLPFTLPDPIDHMSGANVTYLRLASPSPSGTPFRAGYNAIFTTLILCTLSLLMGIWIERRVMRASGYQQIRI